jgi:hypothetical protein
MNLDERLAEISNDSENIKSTKLAVKILLKCFALVNKGFDEG